MSEKMMFGERRLYERKSCMFGVDVNDYIKSYPCHLRDLSLGGALLEATSRFRPELGQKLLVTIAFRGRPGTVVLKGQVVRCQSGCMAIEFEKSHSFSLHHAA